MKYKYLACILLAFSVNANANISVFSTHNDWTGAYIGAQGGYAWGDARWVFPYDQFYTLENNLTFSTRPSGGLGGGQIGYMYQYQNIVAGVEFAYLTGGINQHETGPLSDTFPDDAFTTTINDIRAATVRIGYACLCWQVYAKGGMVDARTNIHALSGVPGAGVVGDVSNNQQGWTAGAGIDYKLDTCPNIVVGLEYDYVKLRNRYFTGTTTGTVVGLPFEVTMHNVWFNTVTAHVNILFL